MKKSLVIITNTISGAIAFLIPAFVEYLGRSASFFIDRLAAGVGFFDLLTFFGGFALPGAVFGAVAGFFIFLIRLRTKSEVEGSGYRDFSAWFPGMGAGLIAFGLMYFLWY